MKTNQFFTSNFQIICSPLSIAKIFQHFDLETPSNRRPEQCGCVHLEKTHGIKTVNEGLVRPGQLFSKKRGTSPNDALYSAKSMQSLVTSCQLWHMHPKQGTPNTGHLKEIEQIQRTATK